MNEIAEDIDFSIHYDLVGITAMTRQVERAYQIADAFRKKNTKVVLGGIHPSFLPEEAKQHADSVVIGEAETLWEQLLSDCEHNKLKPIYKADSMPDLDRLIIPNWKNINLKIYPKRFWEKFPAMTIYTSRGCQFACKFCSVQKYFGKTYRLRPVSHIIKEIDNFPATSYFFIDDNIMCKPDYSRELFKALAKRNITWGSQISSTIIKYPDLIDLAAKSGCVALFVGIESISKSTLQKYNKGFNKVEQYDELIKQLQRVKITPTLSFMFGFDDDTPEQFKQTLLFIKRNKIPFTQFWILTPFPGTEFYTELNNQERIYDHRWSNYDGIHLVFNHDNFSAGQFYELYWGLQQELHKYNNIFKMAWYSSSISDKRFITLFANIIRKMYYRRNVYSYQAPITGGLNPINKNLNKYW
ncbi:MAG: B12-binding domain-containing radical SAM protein [Spirochaetales bacterium]|nr:B12-binding domain-containing radical SAM protein [Spirochaetales bacterium]